MSKDTLYNTIAPGAFWMVNKRLARYLGSLSAAILFADLLAKEQYFRDSGRLVDGVWFWQTGDKLESELMIDKRNRQKIQSVLVEAGFVEIVKMGQPARNHYRINHATVNAVLSSGSRSAPSSGRKSVPTSGSRSAPTLIIINNNKNKNKGDAVDLLFRRHERRTGKPTQITDGRRRQATKTIQAHGLRRLLYAVENTGSPIDDLIGPVRRERGFADVDFFPWDTKKHKNGLTG